MLLFIGTTTSNNCYSQPRNETTSLLACDSKLIALMEHKVVLITGAGSGIGRATALLYAKEGAFVIVADRDAQAGEETVRQILKESTGKNSSEKPRASFVGVDVSTSSQIQNMVAKTVEIYGRLDIAVNNAGIEGERAPTAECSEENFDRVMSVNCKGVFLCMKYEITQMLKQGGGSIVNVSSGAGLTGFAEFPAYSASKHAVLGLTRSAAKEYARKGIRVNAVCPGTTATPMVQRFEERWPELQREINQSYPMGRIATPEEIARAIVWVSSSSCEFMTGHSLAIDGGAGC